MRTVRIYKDDIRINILRSVFFTDTVLAAIGGLIIAGVLYGIFQYIFHLFHLGYYLSILFLTELAFIAALTQKIDNQPISHLVPRAVTHSVKPKKLRGNAIDSYFTDFVIQDNMIVRPKSLIRVFEIDPYDISLLNDQDREHFFVKLKQAIHVLPSQVQVIVRKDQASSKTLSKHVFSLYTDARAKTEPLIANYVKDLDRLVSTNTFNTLRYFIVFSVPADTAKASPKLNGIAKLNDATLRFASVASAARMSMQPLLNGELIEFMKQTLR